MSYRTELDSVRCAMIAIVEFKKSSARNHEELMDSLDRQIQKLEIHEERLKAKIREENEIK